MNSTKIILREINSKPATVKTISHNTGLSMTVISRVLNVLVEANVCEFSFSDRTGEKIYKFKRRCPKCQRVYRQTVLDRKKSQRYGT